MSDSPNHHKPYKQHLPLICGHCGHKSAAEICGYTDMPTMTVGRTDYTTYILLRCDACNRGNMAQGRTPAKFGEILSSANFQAPYQRYVSFQYQWPAPQKPKIPAAMPANVTTVYTEAEKLYSSFFYEPASIQFRKSLEMACRDLGESKDNLAKKIYKLGESKRLSPELVEWAKHIKFIGNAATHDDPLSPDEAKAAATEIRYFSEIFLTFVYTLPARIRANRQEPNPSE